MKTVQKIELCGHPPLLSDIFNLLSHAGAKHFALFGGAVRDADYAARYNMVKPIKDYDLRVWLTPSAEAAFVANLGNGVHQEPSLGTGRLRYCLDFMGAELDISVRPLPEGTLTVSSAAQERAGDSDIGLCSVAIDPAGQAWATSEYLADRDNKTLSVYPMDDLERKNAYTARMHGKFPDHNVIELKMS